MEKKIGADKKVGLGTFRYLKVAQDKQREVENDAAFGEVLTLCLDFACFDRIAAGSANEIYRRTTDHWRRRLAKRRYNAVVLRRGFTSITDPSWQMVRPWGGCSVKSVVDESFGPEPVEVFAIKLST